MEEEEGNSPPNRSTIQDLLFKTLRHEPNHPENILLQRAFFLYTKKLSFAHTLVEDDLRRQNSKPDEMGYLQWKSFSELGEVATIQFFSFPVL